MSTVNSYPVFILKLAYTNKKGFTYWYVYVFLVHEYVRSEPD